MASESLAEIRVELPTHSHSFSLSIPPTSTILDLKHAISRECIGNPEVAGQRIIWSGRVLGDEETIEGKKFVHLSVHPSAWKSTPKMTTTTVPAPTPTVTNTPPPTTATNPATATIPSQLTYVYQLHQQALATLSNSKTTLPDIALRNESLNFIRLHGYEWPGVLDEPYPSGVEWQGVRYEHVVIERKPYLRLVPSSPGPSPAQRHAIEILSYTFTLLSLPRQAPTPTPTHTQRQAHPPHLDALLQRLGLPPLNVLEANRRPVVHTDLPVRPLVPGEIPALQGQFDVPLNDAGPQPQNANPQQAQVVREFEIHLNLGFIIPLILLVFRTLLLLYFLGPRKGIGSIWGILILLWVGWEVLGVIRGMFRRQARAQGGQAGAGGAAAQGQNNGNAAAGGAGAGGAGVPGAGQPNVNPAGADAGGAARPGVGAGAGAGDGNVNGNPRPPTNPFLTSIATYNLDVEDKHLDPSTTNTFHPEFVPNRQEGRPSFTERALACIFLFFATAHPGVWNIRRERLRRREGRVRVENEHSRDPNDPEESEERKQRREEVRRRIQARPEWVQEYARRVVRADWVDVED